MPEESEQIYNLEPPSYETYKKDQLIEEIKRRKAARGGKIYGPDAQPISSTNIGALPKDELERILSSNDQYVDEFQPLWKSDPTLKIIAGEIAPPVSSSSVKYKSQNDIARLFAIMFEENNYLDILKPSSDQHCAKSAFWQNVAKCFIDTEFKNTDGTELHHPRDYSSDNFARKNRDLEEKMRAIDYKDFKYVNWAKANSTLLQVAQRVRSWWKEALVEFVEANRRYDAYGAIGESYWIFCDSKVNSMLIHDWAEYRGIFDELKYMSKPKGEKGIVAPPSEATVAPFRGSKRYKRAARERDGEDSDSDGYKREIPRNPQYDRLASIREAVEAFKQIKKTAKYCTVEDEKALMNNSLVSIKRELKRLNASDEIVNLTV